MAATSEGVRPALLRGVWSDIGKNGVETDIGIRARGGGIHRDIYNLTVNYSLHWSF